ncbi:hypothetical protein ASE12_19160 [Aeromicrobium sp. Root236]|uniref:DUF5819 family protein n=1 Tax=Aeromicrobium sp. Root236 TaxID=1736498 RepID=UPI0006FBEF29|nr:DUF5819 family protein [Aeromicrobium sp. Root236]KRC66700.1 hypothetical protein ASE12_19160 [Aeromicrobium sp. Root236]
MEELKPSRHATPVPSIARRLVIVVIGVVFAIHTALITIWIQPTNPFRDAVGSENIYKYINNKIFPFEQSWSVFAPTPRRGGENVKIRAYYGKPGEPGTKVTEWFDITGNEDQRIKYLVNPSRFHSATRRLGGNINSTVGQFNDKQRLIIAGALYTSPRSKLADLLKQSNTKGIAGLQAVGQYLDNDEMLTRYGTMYATARWGKGVKAVEFQVGHRSVPNFTKRNQENFLDVPFTYYRVGVRKAIPGNADAQAAFDGYVPKAPKTPKSTKDGE